MRQCARHLLPTGSAATPGRGCCPDPVRFGVTRRARTPQRQRGVPAAWNRAPDGPRLELRRIAQHAIRREHFDRSRMNRPGGSGLAFGHLKKGAHPVALDLMLTEMPTRYQPGWNAADVARGVVRSA
jgi:hypothetical protein